MLFTSRLNELAAEPVSTKPLLTMLPAVRIVNCCPPAGREAIDERHVQGAVERRAAGDRQPVVLAARRGPADFQRERRRAAEDQIAAVIHIGGRIPRPQVADVIDCARAGEGAGAALVAKEDRAPAGAGENLECRCGPRRRRTSSSRRRRW